MTDQAPPLSDEELTAKVEQILMADVPRRKKDIQHLVATIQSLTSSLERCREALSPFARIASWHHLTDRNSDGLWVEVAIKFPKGEQRLMLSAKDFRRTSDALEALSLTKKE